MLRGSGSSPVMESLELIPRQLKGTAEQSKDSGSSGDNVSCSSNALRRCDDSIFCSSNPDTNYNVSVVLTENTNIASHGRMLPTTNTDKTSNCRVIHTTKTDMDFAFRGTVPCDSRKRKRQQNHGDNKRRITSEACTGGVFPAPNTAVASCDVLNTSTTTNNTGGDYASSGTISTDSRKKVRRQRKQQTDGERFSALYEQTGEKLGRGCFGFVFTYRNKKTGTEHAVKVMKDCRDLRLRRALIEIETCRRYKNCENILNFVESFRSGDTFVLVFDKMAGGNLRDMLSSTPYLSESQASRVTGAVARALLSLHCDGVAHRDLKPENILCHTPGEVTPLVLCDFGFASEPPSRRNPPKEDTGLILTKLAMTSAVGCPQYMAPEIVGLYLSTSQWRTPYDTRCDMWSLGVLVYEMLVRCLPFVGHCAQHSQTMVRNCRDCINDMFPKIFSGNYSIPTNTRESLSDTAVDLIRHLLVVDPQDRYSAVEVLKHPFVTAHRDDD
ncbi:MAP kinase-interacting serine/threonine-protein kinase 1-like [Aplysia californica]|uniref:MAP kinase-interacting serine/threonine-protein kinase 1-like n=1 Tax=Aplysia californica TaxID=6500 RepID=A0ABM0K5P8_APLCA|nr:MAP kinase-interacting serine/threonine-protein kinase 1-like [Aplysia californica]